MPRVDPSRFEGTWPYDAQYVGAYQPFLGWVGRSGKNHAHQAAEFVVDQVRRHVAVTVGGERRAGDGRSAAARTPTRWMTRLLWPGAEETADLRARLRNVVPTGGRSLVPWRRGGAGEAAPAGSSFRDTQERIGAAAAAVVGAHGGFVTLAEDALGRRPAAEVLAGWIDELDYASRPDAMLLLSPVGLLNLYREYYFDFGTFLGPAIEHVWVAPHSEVELTEEYSRADYRFREIETLFETTEITEDTASESSEFSTEVRKEAARDIAVGVSASGGVNFEVWNVGGNASFDYSNSLQESKQVVRRATRELSSKVATEMRRSVRGLVRETTEIRRASSRRHRIANPTDDLVSYELRRKLQLVGVQLQHVGTQLCWQVYVESPGDDLGIPELVHIAAPDDLLNTAPPETATASLETVQQAYTFEIPFVAQVTRTNDDGISDTVHDYYLWPSAQPPTPERPWLATDDPGEAPADSDDVIVASFHQTLSPPVPGYILHHVVAGPFRGVGTSSTAPSRWLVDYRVAHPGGPVDLNAPDDGKPAEIVAVLRQVNFEDHPAVEVTIQCHWEPSPRLRAAKGAEHEQQIQAYNRAMQQRAQQALVTALRERVELASRVRPRPDDELREEERTIVYRRLVSDLLEGATGPGLHLLSEKVRAVFDVDRMLYYVAPDWWNPTRRPQSGGLTRPEVLADGDPVPLGEAQKVRFGGATGMRPDNYLITEGSDPAPHGSSIGWLLQLDGDRLRNAFLNAPWVKAVIPIRPGREVAALEWLKQEHIEGADGLAAEFVDDDGRRTNQTVEDKLREVARTIRRHGGEDRRYAAGERIFETGFAPLEGGLGLTGEPFEVFAQWIEVVPTKQVVPMRYPPGVTGGDAEDEEDEDDEDE